MHKETKKEKTHTKLRVLDPYILPPSTIDKRPDPLTYEPTPEAIKLAYFLADPYQKMKSHSQLSRKFNIPIQKINRLLTDRKFLTFLNELVPVTTDILIAHAYKRLRRELKVSPHMKGNKGVEAAKVIFQAKNVIKNNQTNILNANFSLEKMLDKLLASPTKKEEK